jgi:hypothetical protein
VLTSVFPVNEHCAWLTPPTFDPSRVPKVFSRGGQFELPPTVFVDVMSALTGDIRFKGYFFANFTCFQCFLNLFYF